MTLPKGLYAPLGRGPSRDQARSLTTQLSIATAAGRLNNLEAREVEYALHRPQHRHHFPTGRLVALLQMAERHYDHDPVGCLMQMAAICDLDHLKLLPLGTLTTLVWFARQLGLVVKPPYYLCTAATCQPVFWQVSGRDKKAWQHDVREMLRCMSLSLLVSRRPQFQGLEHGLCRASSLANATDPHFVRWVRSWQLDGLLWPARQTALKGANPDCCPRCLAAPDTLFHRLWQCGALSHLRTVRWSQVCLWPPCAFMHGLVPKDFRGSRDLLLSVRVQAFTLFLAAEVYDGSPSEPVPLECPTLFAFKDRSVRANAGTTSEVRTMPAQPLINGGTALLKGHEVRAKTVSAWECQNCGRLNTGTWEASRHCFL